MSVHIFDKITTPEGEGVVICIDDSAVQIRVKDDTIWMSREDFEEMVNDSNCTDR